MCGVANGVGVVGAMSFVLDSVRQDLLTAAWAAMRARQQHGEGSQQYGKALLVLDSARRLNDAAGEIYESGGR